MQNRTDEFMVRYNQAALDPMTQLSVLMELQTHIHDPSYNFGSQGAAIARILDASYSPDTEHNARIFDDRSRGVSADYWKIRQMIMQPTMGLLYDILVYRGAQAAQQEQRFEMEDPRWRIIGALKTAIHNNAIALDPAIKARFLEILDTRDVTRHINQAPGVTNRLGTTESVYRSLQIIAAEALPEFALPGFLEGVQQQRAESERRSREYSEQRQRAQQASDDRMIELQHRAREERERFLQAHPEGNPYPQRDQIDQALRGEAGRLREQRGRPGPSPSAPVSRPVRNPQESQGVRRPPEAAPVRRQEGVRRPPEAAPVSRQERNPLESQGVRRPSESQGVRRPQAQQSIFKPVPEVGEGPRSMAIEKADAERKIEIPKELLCPITMAMFKDPVKVEEVQEIKNKDGTTEKKTFEYYFERTAILQMIENGRGKTKNPFTRKDIREKDLIDAPEMKAKVEAYKESVKSQVMGTSEPKKPSSPGTS